MIQTKKFIKNLHIKMKCFLFDIDGTLTEPRQPMDSEFAIWFENWVSERNVYLISGSDLPKIQEQIPSKILNKCKGVFSCMGNEFWIDNKNVYKNQLEIPEEVENFLESKIVNSDFEHRKPPHFEYRTGMLNFSIVGRGASQSLRLYYSEWDEMRQERYEIAKEFNKLFNKKYDIEALAGGQISLDIQGIGKDKGQAIDHLDYDNYVFFGDKCTPSGNDFALYKRVEEKWHVQDYKQTFSILKNKYV